MTDSGQSDIQISVRMPAPLVRALESKAAGADRTLSGEIRRALRRHVEQTTPNNRPGNDRPTRMPELGVAE